MFFSKRIISVLDKERLLDTVARERRSWASHAPYLELFPKEIRRTPALEPADVPADAITMNARFTLEDPWTGERASYTLVYPDEVVPREGRISVASRMGMALLGARAGDDVVWSALDGPVVARVTDVHYQPEAALRRGRADREGAGGPCPVWLAERVWEDDGGPAVSRTPHPAPAGRPSTGAGEGGPARYNARSHHPSPEAPSTDGPPRPTSRATLAAGFGRPVRRRVRRPPDVDRRPPAPRHADR